MAGSISEYPPLLTWWLQGRVYIRISPLNIRLSPPADLVAAGQGLHAGSVGAAYHALLLVGPGRLLVLTLDLEQEAVLTTEGDLVTASSGAGGDILTILPVSLSSSSSRWCGGPGGGSWGSRRYCWNLRSMPMPAN